MSVITPILTTPSEYCACAAPHPSATGNAIRLNSRFIVCPPPHVPRTSAPCSHARIVVTFFDIVAGSLAFENDRKQIKTGPRVRRHGHVGRFLLRIFEAASMGLPQNRRC